MSLNKYQSKEVDLISSEYDRYRGETIDKIDDLLLITQQNEMDSKIHKNCLAILKILKNVQNKLHNNSELEKEEIENFIYCLKFLDTLNIFMRSSMIDSMLKLTEEISNLLHSANLFKYKEDLLHKIKYAEKSVVYFKKKVFKSLYFSDPAYLCKEIEKSLLTINQSYEYSNNFDRKIFKQMQNIFWVLQKKLNEEQKIFLQKLIDDLKGINFKSRSRRYNSYYDYNDSQNYYSFNYYDNSNNYYGYSNYNNTNSNQHRRTDYYDPYYKKADLIELPDIIHNPIKIEDETNSSQFKNSDKIPDESFNNFKDQINSEKINNEYNHKDHNINEFSNFLNKSQIQDQEKLYDNHKIIGFQTESKISNFNYTRVGNEHKARHKNKNFKIENFKEVGQNISDLKSAGNMESNTRYNQISQEKIYQNEVKLSVIDDFGKKDKFNNNECNNEIQNFNSLKGSDNIKDISNLMETPYNKDNIETVIVSNINEKEFSNYNKNFNSYFGNNNSKSNKKQKEYSNQNYYSNSKPEKEENKSTTKKSKKLKSHSHLLVEVDFSKMEKEKLINNEPENIQKDNVLIEKDHEINNNKSNIGEIDQSNINEKEYLTDTTKETKIIDDKYEKDNIEIIRHYQSDFEYNKEYNSSVYGKYNSKYYKNYQNFHTKQNSITKNYKNAAANTKANDLIKTTECNVAEPKIVDSITPTQKINEEDMVVSNFNSVSAIIDKDNSSSFNSKPANFSINNNTKFKNKTYNTYNAYNFGGYNNHKFGNQVGKEKVYSDKEYLSTYENEKKNKYVIKEVEFSDKQNETNLPNTESIHMEINKFINNQDNHILNDDNKNKEEKEDYKIISSIMKNNDKDSFDNQLIKSNSDLAANLNDLKFMNLKVNIENFPHSIDNNENIEKSKKDEKIDEVNKEKNESNTKYNEIAYEKVTAVYNNNHSRFNVSNNIYRGNNKNKISKLGKFQQHLNTNLPVENSVNTLIDNHDKHSKNYFNNSKQSFNYIKDHSNNFSGKNYNNNIIESNNFYQNKNNFNNFYEKSNYSTNKKKSYLNNYNKHEKNFEVSTVLNFEEPFQNKKPSEVITKDEKDADFKNLQQDQLGIIQIESNDKEMPLNEDKELVNINDSNNKIIDSKKEHLNNEFYNNNNFYSNKGHSNNFNSLNNNIETRENVYNQNYYENHAKNFNKEYSNINNVFGNTNHFIMNKNNTYLKQQRGSNINNYNNDNEIYPNIYNNQENLFNKNSNHYNNYNEIKTKNKRHSNAFESNYYDAKAFENSKISPNPTTNYFYNEAIDTEDNISKIKGKEDYDYTNQNIKLKNKKGKNSKLNNINMRGNTNLIYNQNTNFNNNNEQLISCMFNNANISTQTKFNNINSNLSNYPINNYISQNYLQNTIHKKPTMNYNYNSTDIGLFNNIMGIQNKTNQNFNNNNINNPNFMNLNSNMTSNLNMFNYNLMNYIAQMNYLNKINPINIIPQNNFFNNQIQTFDNEIENNNNSKFENSNDLNKIVNKNDLGSEGYEIKFQDSQNTILKPTKSLQVNEQQLKPEEYEIKIKNKKEVENTDSASTIAYNDQLKNTLNNTITSPKEHKTIGVFNMDIEKFFQSDAKNLNFNNISQLEKKESNIENNKKSSLNEVVNVIEKSELIPTIKNVQNSFQLNPDDKKELKENKQKKLNNNFKQKFDLLTSENDTEKELINNNSYEEENESDEEPYSDSSESIANEEIDAAFETFQHEIRQMNSLPIAIEDDDYYIAESDYIDQNKGKKAKNNKAIFEEGDSNNELSNLKLETGKIDSSTHEKNPFKKEKNLNKVCCIGSDEEEVEEDDEEEEELSETDLLTNPEVIFNNQIKEKDDEMEKEGMHNYIKNANNKTPINNSKNTISLDNFEELDKSSNNPKNKHIINNQIFNNFNFYNMQMFPNPNMIQYLRNLSAQKGQSNISSNTLNLMKIIENSKMMNFNLTGIKNTNNLGMNQGFNSNTFFSAQQNHKSLREQTKLYSESIKTIDPDLLKIIKNKLTENTNTQPNQESVNSSDQLHYLEANSKEDQAINNEDIKEKENSETDDNIKFNNNQEVKQESKRNTCHSKKLSNSDVNDRKNSKAETHIKSLESNQEIINNNIDSHNNQINDLQQHENVISNENQLNNATINKNSLFQNNLMSNWSNFIFRGRDSNIHRDYLTLKFLENENQHLISRNIEGFENRILIPIYQKLIFNVNKRKGVYFFTFNKYRKIICKVLQNSKILKKVKPYGSLMNNFMIDSGDIDICIVPNCSILEFAIYLDKIKEELISQVIKILF